MKNPYDDYLLKTSTKEAFQKTISILVNDKYNSYAILICIMINLFKLRFNYAE